MKDYIILNQNHLPVDNGQVEYFDEIGAVQQYLQRIGKSDYIAEDANSGGKPLKYGMTLYVLERDQYSNEEISHFMKRKLMKRFFARPPTEARRYARRRK